MDNVTLQVGVVPFGHQGWCPQLTILEQGSGAKRDVCCVNAAAVHSLSCLASIAGLLGQRKEQLPCVHAEVSTAVCIRQGVQG